jgi:hypothetical protein
MRSEEQEWSEWYVEPETERDSRSRLRNAGGMREVPRALRGRLVRKDRAMMCNKEIQKSDPISIGGFAVCQREAIEQPAL